MTTARLVPHAPTARPVGPGLAAPRIAYSDLATTATSLGEQDSWHPTRCAGWSVRDLLVHLLSDAQHAPVAPVTPAPGPADRDAVGCWAGARFGDDAGFHELRALRTTAGARGPVDLTRVFCGTTRAVVTPAGRAAHDALVATQGHVLRVDDLLALVVGLSRPGPRAGPLATLDGLLGRPTPPEWGDERWALIGTGRVPQGGGERRGLGAAAARLPLLG